MITAVETTPGNVAENHRLLPLIEQHEKLTGQKVTTAIGDSKYGTTNTVRCPGGQTMKARRLHPTKRTWEYQLPRAVCAACALRAQCTRARQGSRTVHRHEHHELLERARAQSHSAAGRRDRQRRQHLLEGSFAAAANNHGFKRARWRRLWRVQIQDWLIAAIQNIKILLQPRLPLACAPAAAQIIPFSVGPRPRGRLFAFDRPEPNQSFPYRLTPSDFSLN